ncbi:ATP-binding protein [Catenovulum sp. 2E275]|uniref:ATP-binding protein n=1 Tax=Catenovulum sp. 2E275 TaxID=2980497 RepID=UPI0021D32C65|nr:ATP-binding protein [Catenovulum sp. 2E275]MCU4674926.1 ATP-binding protein [Catenovulum sp. 2E275]
MTMPALARLSFKHRLIICNLLITLIILPLFGFSLYKAFEAQAKLTEEQALKAYSYNLLAASEINNNQLTFTGELDAPGFSLPDSGLYALIRNKQTIVWHSASFILPGTQIQWQDSKVGNSQFNQISVNHKPHFNWQLKVEFEQNGQIYPYTFHIIKSKQDYQSQLDTFTRNLWQWLAIIGFIFICLQFLWLIWFEKPLKQLSAEISLIEQGEKTQISDNYPVEISRFNQNLNRLIQTEQQQRQRYKNTLADLAHSLKTPLAVIVNHPKLPDDIKPELNKIDNIISHQLKKAQSGQTSWQQGCKIAPITKAIITSLEKIYHQKQIEFIAEIDESAIFYGAEADLYELLGNLLDNACKACQQQVKLQVSSTNVLVIKVSDDGKGLAPQQTQDILKRGHRADTYQAGHGIGLAIVQDLVQSYQAKLSVIPKSELGGAQFIIEFGF